MKLELPGGYYSFLEAIGREILKYRDEAALCVSAREARGAAVFWLMRRGEDINRLTAAAHIARQYLPDNPHMAHRLFDSALEPSDLESSPYDPAKYYICRLLRESRDDAADFAQMLNILCYFPG
jgi:hypothetical protein